MMVWADECYYTQFSLCFLWFVMYNFFVNKVAQKQITNWKIAACKNSSLLCILWTKRKRMEKITCHKLWEMYYYFWINYNIATLERNWTEFDTFLLKGVVYTLCVCICMHWCVCVSAIFILNQHERPISSINS